MKRLALTIFVITFALAYPALSKESAKSVHEFKFIPKETFGNKDTPAIAVINGEDCNDLRAQFFTLKKDKVLRDVKLVCAPDFDYRQNINHLKVRYIDIMGMQISFEDGPTLFGIEGTPKTKAEFMRDIYPPWAAGLTDHTKFDQMVEKIPTDAKYVGNAFFHVKNIDTTCSASGSDFCATIDNHNFGFPRLNDTYAIYCWECTEIKKSPEALQNAILGTRSAEHLILQGGYAFPLWNIGNIEVEKLKKSMNDKRFSRQ